MYKFLILSALFAACAAAPGLISAPVAAPWGAAPWGAAPWGASPWGHGVLGASYAAPVVKAALPVATSYANTVKIASPVAYAAPAYAASAYAAPAYAAPAYAAHAPVLAAPAYAHAW